MAVALAMAWFKSSLHSQLRDRVLAEIEKKLAGSDFRCRLEDARWIEGQGLTIDGLVFDDLVHGEALVTIDQIFFASSFQLTDILSHKPVIDFIELNSADLNLRIQDKRPGRVIKLLDQLRQNSKYHLDCPVRVANSKITIHAGSILAGGQLPLANINLDYARDGENREAHRLVGHVSCRLGGRLKFDALINQSNRNWRAHLASDQLEIDQYLVETIQRLTGHHSVIQNLRGRVSLQGSATGNFDLDSTPSFHVSGRASGLQCLDQSLPQPVHDCSFDYSIGNQKSDEIEIHVNRLQSHLGYGTASGDLVIADPLNIPRWRLVGRVTEFQLTERLPRWMPNKLRQAWDEYSPQGIVDAQFDFQFDGRELKKIIRAEVQSGSISWDRFPYRFNRGSGSITWNNNQVELDLKAVEAQQLLTLKGHMTNPGPDWTGWIHAECAGQVPVNEKLWQALDHLNPKVAKTLRKFNATGHVSGRGRIEKRNPQSQPQKRFDINIHQATIRHSNFDYPIYNVNGLCIIKNDQADFQRLTGLNSNGTVQCSGNWTRSNGLQLRFLANDVALNHELRTALAPGIQNAWQGIRPSGTVDLIDVDLHYPPMSKSPIIGVSIQMVPERDIPSTVSINPIWFPYEIRHITGRFRFEKQRIEIRDFAGNHGSTQVRANGRGTYDDANWKIRFSDIFASDLRLNESLLKALPVSLKNGLERTRFAGKLAMQGSVEMAGEISNDQRLVATLPPVGSLSGPGRPMPKGMIDWDLEFGIAQASANLGLPIENANGLIHLKGRYSAGRVNCLGRLNFDSLTWRDIQVTSVAAPISIDNNLIGIGALASLPNDLQNGRTQMPSGTARIFNGYLEFDGQVQLNQENDFFIQAKLTDGELADFATEAAIEHHDFSGRAFAKIQLRGNASGTHSTKGGGTITLREARIYEVPVILALLNVLRIQEPDRTAFDQGQMEFSVNGENIDFQRIELNGDSLSLIGKGTVNLDSQVNLDFYTTMGRNRWFIPVLTRLYHAGARQVWWIQVDGALSSPRTRHQVLPGLNESLKRLFPEFESANSQ